MEEWGPTNGEKLLAAMAAEARAERVRKLILMLCAVAVIAAAVKYLLT